MISIHSLQGILIASCFATYPCFSHTFSQKVSGYQDNQGQSRKNFKTALGLDKSFYGRLTGVQANASMERELLSDDSYQMDEYYIKHYGSDQITKDTTGLQLTTTWFKITDLRLMASESRDSVVRTQNLSIGASQWLAGETLQVALDSSLTTSWRPENTILLETSDIAKPPKKAKRQGLALGFKHLTTPTTISSLTYSVIDSNERPRATTTALGIRQFIKPLNGALHSDLTRAQNRGATDFHTDYGEVDAWIIENAWVQNFSTDSMGKISYRYYQEDETTQVFKEEIRRGSDAVSLFYSIDVSNERSQKNEPVVLEFMVARYFTNENFKTGEKLTASMLEVGLNKRF